MCHHELLHYRVSFIKQLQTLLNINGARWRADQGTPLMSFRGAHSWSFGTGTRWDQKHRFYFWPDLYKARASGRERLKYRQKLFKKLCRAEGVQLVVLSRWNFTPKRQNGKSRNERPDATSGCSPDNVGAVLTVITREVLGKDVSIQVGFNFGKSVGSHVKSSSFSHQKELCKILTPLASSDSYFPQTFHLHFDIIFMFFIYTENLLQTPHLDHTQNLSQTPPLFSKATGRK